MTLLTLLYLLRIPLLVALLWVALAFLSLRKGSPIYAIGHGVFDTSAKALAFVAAQTLFLIVSLSLVSRLVIDYGRDRFSFTPPPHTFYAVTAFYVLCGAIFLTLAVRACRDSYRHSATAFGISMANAIFAVGNLYWREIDQYVAATIQPFLAIAGPGYLSSEGDLLPGHLTAAFFLLLLLTLYALFAFRIFSTPATLVSLLNLATLVLYAFAGLAFYFDHYRFPFQLAFLTLLILSALLYPLDHYFRTVDLPSRTPVTPRDALAAGPSDCAIIVCAQGGGIQASAWTTQVLASLTEECPGFSSHLRLISSVSGGSTGAMYALPMFGPNPIPAAAVRDAGVASSLDQGAFGLVYRDVPRLLLPWFLRATSDRGQTLEDAWAAQPAAPPAPTTLSSYRQQVLAGQRPANIFNSMIAETGQRFLMATVDTGSARGHRDFYQLYPNTDLHPATAARLSATFPVASPAARIDRPSPYPFHYVDGGYYDNFGVASAVDFLLDATKGGSPKSRILILEIVALPGEEQASAPSLPARGWAFQLIAPILALIQMRTSAQVSRNQIDLTMLGDVLENRGVTHYQTLRFSFPSPDGPLSWHLTADEVNAIRDAWPRMSDQVNQVRRFLDAAQGTIQ